ncbi:hypothetical protein [Deinococcus hopiensis]|uniref:Uncharacterized protein n=1 Tax=Deinococcus hopiensis KR-140 TaxID=695939 RepID=A0A1W1UPB9_9DEIO|nr:hypothetical protein [Deinococcus hopiensis]SMB82554.1 hypothetical protein SAMN00790413_04059 [Deinococcus hopiensis KR-140]
MAKFVKDVWGRYINVDVIQYLDLSTTLETPVIYAYLSIKMPVPDAQEGEVRNVVVLEQFGSGVSPAQVQSALEALVQQLH